jgi:hypothetical protein
MAADQYRARAAELLAQSKLEPDKDAATMLETVAICFQQLADTPAPPVEFDFHAYLRSRTNPSGY